MKGLKFLLPVFAALLAACSNDFEVTAPWKEVPVVYGILSAKDTANYIRVEKAFLDPDKSALVIAQIPDSIYYPANAISVFLERPAMQSRVQLERIDGNLDGYPRDGGIFASSPNWLYRLKTPPGGGLSPGETYRLVIERADGQPDITAQTTVPADFLFLSPSQAQTPPLIVFKAGTTTEFSWRADVNSAFFSLKGVIRYREEAGNGTVLGHYSVQWTLANNIPRGEFPTQIGGQTFYRTSYKAPANELFRLLADSIAPTSDRFRYFEGSEFTLEGGGSEIRLYLENASANSGITGSEILTTYTNLSEGFGIFTAKNTSTLNSVKILPETVNSMNDDVLTKPLNFRY